MTRALLDTHVFLWLMTEPERVPPGTLATLRDPETELLLSAASAWEMAIKVRLGRLRMSATPESSIPQRMAETNITALPVQLSHALRVATLPLHHRDPFDRLLIAQALVEHIPIITHDPQFAPYGVQLIW